MKKSVGTFTINLKQSNQTKHLKNISVPYRLDLEYIKAGTQDDVCSRYYQFKILMKICKEIM